MGIKKNVASQKLAVYAYDPTVAAGTDPSKTGDAANITAQISLDGGTSAATNDVNPTELDATDQAGVYIFDLTQAETNAEMIMLSAVSATSNILLDPVQVLTEPEKVTLADAAHGGTAATLALKKFEVIATDTNAEAVMFVGDGIGHALYLNATSGSGLQATSVSGTGIGGTSSDGAGFWASSTSSVGFKATSISGTDITSATIEAIPTLAEILAGGDVDGFTIEETLKLCLAALAGKLSGAETTTITIRSAADDANRIVATVDADGNRSAVTLDASG